MKTRDFFCIIGLLAIIVFPAHAADETGWIEVGLRGGVSADSRQVDFEQYDLFASYRLEQRWELKSGWLILTEITGTLGEVRSDFDSGIVATFGPGFTFKKPDSRFSIDIASVPTYISEPVHGEKDLGGNIHFTTHIRFNYRINEEFAIGYRFQHMSNASLEDENPGLNIQSLGISYLF